MDVTDQDVRAEALLRVAQKVACEIRDDVAAVHRLIAHLDRPDLEALACILAALVPIDERVYAWWQIPATDVYEQRRRVLNEAMTTRGTKEAA